MGFGFAPFTDRVLKGEIASCHIEQSKHPSANGLLCLLEVLEVYVGVNQPRDDCRARSINDVLAGEGSELVLVDRLNDSFVYHERYVGMDIVAVE